MTTIDLACTYLGNYLNNQELQQKVEAARAAGCCLEIELNQNDQAKSRIYAKSTSNIAVGIIKERGRILFDGDVFKTQQQKLLVVHLKNCELIALSCSSEQPGYALALIHLGHTLGNHHYPILVTKDKIYVQLVTDKDIIETTIQKFNIPGLKVNYETLSFEHYLKLTSCMNSHFH
jgi:urease accessory protein